MGPTVLGDSSLVAVNPTCSEVIKNFLADELSEIAIVEKHILPFLSLGAFPGTG